MSSSAEIRAHAARNVAQVIGGRSLDAIAIEAGSAQERGLLRSLVYDSIRWYIRLDALLVRLLARPKQHLDPEVRALAIVGLCQLLYSDIPEHAAVAETVNAARVLGQPRAAGLLNALLRRCQRESGALLEQIDADIGLRTAHPRWLVDALRAEFGEQLESVLNANNARPPFWLRVNRRRIATSEYRQQLAAAGLDVIATRGEESLLLDRAVDVSELPGFAAGLVSIQDAAAQLAAHLVAPAAGDRVLDACAAPGGKTCHLLELQPGISELTAVDVSASRLERVAQNLSRLGLSARLIEGDASTPDAWWDGTSFDRILLDVPCSATGVIRRHPDIKLLRRRQDIASLSERQASVLERLWSVLAVGGRLVYASCSALRTENARVVSTFIERHAEARDVTSTAARQIGMESSETAGLRIAAGTAEMDGFYYACLEKTKG